LNTLGMTHMAQGAVEKGVGQLRRAIEIAQESGNIDALGYAYTNLADLLNLRGRTDDALAAAHEGIAALPRQMRVNRDWVELTLSEVEFDAGDWTASRQHLAAPPSQMIGVLLIFRLLREAEL